MGKAKSSERAQRKCVRPCFEVIPCGCPGQELVATLGVLSTCCYLLGFCSLANIDGHALEGGKWAKWKVWVWGGEPAGTTCLATKISVPSTRSTSSLNRCVFLHVHIVSRVAFTKKSCWHDWPVLKQHVDAMSSVDFSWTRSSPSDVELDVLACVAECT